METLIRRFSVAVVGLSPNAVNRLCSPVPPAQMPPGQLRSFAWEGWWAE
ncbi:hypothetical protein [Arthrobacter sp. NyZ413]